MTRPKLLLRNLSHFRAANLAVIAGMAVATAVLTGALLVGDSVRGSLRDLAIQRLGPIDHVLVSTHFFNQDLATRIRQSPGFQGQYAQCLPAISLRGGAADAQNQSRTGGVQIAAIAGDWAAVPPGHLIVNQQLADDLQLTSSNKTLLLSLPSIDETPKDASLARRDLSSTTSGMRLDLDRIATQPGLLSLFNLAGSQRLPRNAWVNLTEIQNAIGQPGRANLLLVQSKSDALSNATTLNTLLRQSATLDDYGLKFDIPPNSPDAILNSRTTYISPTIDHAATAAASALDIPLRRVSIYLINNVVKLSDPSSTIHYAIAAGLSDLEGQPIAPDEIAMNSWAADQLRAKVGDSIRLDYYQRQPNGELTETSSALTFKVAKILPLAGLGADPSLTPTYKGLTDKSTIQSWDAPEGLEINKKLVTRADEDYWKQHKASPKIFLNLATAQKLWGTAYGDLNSIRLPKEKSAAFAQELLKQIDPAELGLSFRPIKAEQLAAASGSTDFAGLFVGFSFFIIAAAAILLAMLFRLAIEQRVRQFGLLAALGFTAKSLRRLALAEGMLLALIGGVIGTLVSLAYTWLMIYGLRTRWVGAVGTTSLTLHAEPLTLLIGLVSSLFIAWLAIGWAIRRLSRAEPWALLAGGWGIRPSLAAARGAASFLFPAILALLALTTLLLPSFTQFKPQYAFLSAGTLLLISSLLFTCSLLRPHRHERPPGPQWSLGILGIRNASRHRARSTMTIALIAFASFVLVTVSSMKQQPSPDTRDKTAGTGGYQLILQTEVPLQGDLNTLKGRKLIGIEDPNAPIFSTSQFLPMRTWAGQDISCLNLTRPTAPTILGVPPALGDRRAFTQLNENPWALLTQSSNDFIPIIADSETAAYILHLSVGDTLPITDQAGRSRNLKLVATLSHSIFQSELLMADAHFRELFPSQSGFSTILIETDQPDVLRKLLSHDLQDYAITIEPTPARLARYLEVANTYLSTFQTLGSLGLLLGTIGLAVILLRGLIERKAELALLSALGFPASSRLTLILCENLFLLLTGLLTGTACALVGILPTLLTSHRSVNLLQLSATLSCILLTGLLTLLLATHFGNRRITPADLRAT